MHEGAEMALRIVVSLPPPLQTRIPMFLRCASICISQFAQLQSVQHARRHTRI